MSKLSVIVPVYCNEDTLDDLYNEIQVNLLPQITDDLEFVFVDDGSKDNSMNKLETIVSELPNSMVIHLSRNFGSHAAILCGLTNCTGDCAVVKSADLQEPISVVLEMFESWKKGNNVVLGLRSGRNDGKLNDFFSNFYYALTRRFALPNMPKNGFDIYLLDRKVFSVLTSLSETDSALTCQILWAGFTTGIVFYQRIERTKGTSKWTINKKIKLVKDTLFSFSSLPITVITTIGVIAFIGSVAWAFVVLCFKLTGNISVSGFTTLFIFNLFSFGTIMMTLGIFGEYLWRTFNSSKKRPVFIEEKRIKHSKNYR